MTERAGLPDYATMQRAIDRIHDADLLVGVRCPGPGCGGTLRRGEGRLVCDDCGRDATGD